MVEQKLDAIVAHPTYKNHWNLKCLVLEKLRNYCDSDYNLKSNEDGCMQLYDLVCFLEWLIVIDHTFEPPQCW